MAWRTLNSTFSNRPAVSRWIGWWQKTMCRINWRRAEENSPRAAMSRLLSDEGELVGGEVELGGSRVLARHRHHDGVRTRGGEGHRAQRRREVGRGRGVLVKRAADPDAIDGQRVLAAGGVGVVAQLDLIRAGGHAGGREGDGLASSRGVEEFQDPTAGVGIVADADGRAAADR